MVAGNKRTDVTIDVHVALLMLACGSCRMMLHYMTVIFVYVLLLVQIQYYWYS